MFSWGLELRFLTENDNDFLIFGVDEGFLRKYPIFIPGGSDAFSAVLQTVMI